MSNPSGGLYAFGSYRLDAASRVLTRSGTVVSLAPKTFDLLVVMAESGGVLLSKRQLLDALWHETFVEEANLSFQVSTLRKALGEEGALWIEAVPKFGYRFNAPLEPIASTGKLPPDGLEPKLQESLISPSPHQAPPPTRSYFRQVWVLVALAGAIVIFAAFAIWVRWPHIPKQAPSAALNAFPATTYRGRETNPSFSPDGSQIAFAWDAADSNNFDIYVKVVGENKALRLTTDPRPEFSPVWSPDGRRIAFCRDGPSGSEIVLISALGGPEQILASLPKQADPERPDRPLSWLRGIWYPNTYLAWFPDGLSLAAVARLHQSGPNRIFLLSVDEREMKPLTSPPDRSWGDHSPAISPDGRRLAFTRSPTQYPEPAYPYWKSLTNPTTAPGEPKRLTAQEADTAGLAWTSDGRRLLFRSERTLWAVGLDGGTPEPLSLRGFNPTYPAISVNRHRLAFVDSTGDRDIWRVNGPAAHGISAGPSTAGTRLISSTRLDTNPQYSPDGSRIAFTSLRSGTFQLWLCDGDGSNPLQLTNFDGETGTPNWSPDGRYITFDSLKSGTGDIYVLPSQGGPDHRLTPINSHEDMASWSHDGKWIYFESDRSGTFEIWKMPSSGGTALRVTDNGGAEAFESFDGNYVYYTKWEQHGIWRTPVAGGPETLVMNIGSTYLWGVFNKGLCAVDLQATAGSVIKCLDFDSSRITTVFSLPQGSRFNEGGPSFAISPDGRSILYVGVDRQESDIMVVDHFR